MQRRKFLAISSGAVSTAATTVTSTATLGASATPTKSALSAKKPFAVKAGQDRFNQPILYQGVNPNLVKISAKDTGDQLAVFEYEGFAKIGPPLHMHLHQDEIFYVVEGKFLFQVGKEKQTLIAGDTIFLPRNIPHTWLQLSEKGKLIYLLQPAGNLEDFFKQMNAFKRPPTFAEEQQVSREHGVETLGPPLKME
ncbi:cupin domain-containing protein [Spirosoma sp. BT702]|uniref:Cupin domain-containing protein n=1 Tax=Spirosoma profusum TaxID=2771354 RepID=A0A927AVV4_9BACT|nr:cupin domain-containing protein [Spirosoma profusum]MBD2705362.1 cupin domain-containing protein [Spirosoma profusum]